ncbi:barstar family protein [Streptacidiphilus jiangxiensis]|uniref:Barstar (Barnase inhibitor) n=1 Tax=Streptacidiphilus jiangxiensis TaxID=235985 RepID=A0A1H7ZLX2_STRJI|nr:barstar family protein [Streptacidiphilus jiangxiensis]SEM59263.1 Barstar (barnase inhibitor) [Streptacidiphilus jiangxiensis]
MSEYSSPDGDTDEAAGVAAAPVRLYRELAAHTFVTLYWRPEVFDRTVERLRAHRFAVVEVNASGWATAEAMHEDLATALDFPDYYGRNLDALNDCLRDVVAGAYGIPADATGFALAFTHYDRFARACPREAQVVLDILADHGRHAAVIGQRVLCLVQSDDPDITFEPVGSMGVAWNPAEWLDARRRA